MKFEFSNLLDKSLDFTIVSWYFPLFLKHEWQNRNVLFATNLKSMKIFINLTKIIKLQENKCYSLRIWTHFENLKIMHWRFWIERKKMWKWLARLCGRFIRSSADFLFRSFSACSVGGVCLVTLAPVVIWRVFWAQGKWKINIKHINLHIFFCLRLIACISAFNIDG